MLVGLIGCLTLWLQCAPPRAGLLAAMERAVRDPLVRQFASDEPESRIVIIDIDESSLSSVGAWPWPRARLADLADTLVGHYQARAVGLDIVFPAPSDAAGDERLAALGSFAPLVFAQALDFVPRVPAATAGQLVTAQASLPSGFTGAPATGYLANHAGLSGVRCVGNIGLQPDADGVVRHVPLAAQWRGAQIPLLPLAMIACPLHKGGAVQVPDAALAGISGAHWSLPFSRDWSAYTVIPASAILDGSAPLDLVRGRWVLVGSSALGLNDRAATPLSAAAAGVMVHAAAMTALLDRIEGRSVALPVPARWIASAWTVATLLLAAWALGRFRAWWLIPGAAAAVVSWLALAGWLLPRSGSFSASGPLVAYGAMLLVISVELWMAQREQGRILRSFATYVAPSVLDKMLRQGLENPMLPQHCDITVVSADMQDYTGLTKRSDLHEAARVTREFLQCLTEPILAFGGTLDKYTGDGLVAFWGAPLPAQDHAQRALDAAQAMVRAVLQWNEGRVRQGLPPARVRIGVESGPVLVGDLGTRFRRTYTAVGDCINTASKLQAAAKPLTCDLVVGPVAARLAADAGLAPVAEMRLPGHNEVSVLWSFPSLGSSVPAARQSPLDRPQPQHPSRDVPAL